LHDPAPVIESVIQPLPTFVAVMLAEQSAAAGIGCSRIAMTIKLRLAANSTKLVCPVCVDVMRALLAETTVKTSIFD